MRTRSTRRATTEGSGAALTPDLRQLRYFMAVAETGQFTDAARRLGVAQPTLSQALAQLEDQLGVHLLERHARGVRLTPAGSAFLEKARESVVAADEAGQAAQAFKRAEHSSLAVGFDWVPLTRWSPMFRELCDRHPGTRLTWSPLDFPRADRAPIAGVDVGLVLEPTPRPEIAALPLLREPLVVMMSPSHPLAAREAVTVADLLDEVWPGGHPSLDPRWYGFWSFAEQRGGPARTTDDRVASAEEGAAVVAAGRAIATTPATLAAAFPHPGIAAVPIADAPPATLALAWHVEHQNPLVDELVEIARRQA